MLFLYTVAVIVAVAAVALVVAAVAVAVQCLFNESHSVNYLLMDSSVRQTPR